MKLTLEQAKETAEKLKLKYKFGKSGCPKWFSNTCVAMRQDGSYSVEICIPDWSLITEEENNELLEPFENCLINLRVVHPAPIYVFDEKPAEQVDIKKKPRGRSRKGYR